MLHLVTGGAGFIGSHLVETLLNKGCQVRVVDNLLTGKKENLSKVLSDIEFIHGDLCDLNIAKQAVDGVDCIFHEAALPSVPRSLKDPFQTQRSGEITTLILLEEAVKANVRRIIFASSSSVYGDTLVLPKVETVPPRPQSPYAAGKLACEGYMSAYTSCYPIDTVSLRYFNVFGLRQDPSSQYSGVISRFINLMAKGQNPVIYGNGEQTRDFCYIENIVEANLLAMDAARNLSGEIINIACGQRILINDLVSILNNLLGSNIEPRYEKPRKGDVVHSLADISKASRILEYKPAIDIETGLKKFLQKF